MANPHKDIFKANHPAPDTSNTTGSNDETTVELKRLAAMRGGIKAPRNYLGRQDQTRTKRR